jgi:putative endonuclease
VIPIHSFGKKGEEAAVQYLQRKGHRLLATNYSSRFGEIDIITQFQNILVFTEVKSRTSTAFGTPAEAVTRKKLNSIIATSNIFISQHKDLPQQVRYDVIEVSQASRGEFKLDVIENVTI